jgi:hypothetical protein
MDTNASGQCVVPWGNGTKAVTSVVLIANGTSFAVRQFHSLSSLFLICIPDHDSYFYDYQLSGRLWNVWEVAASCHDSYLLGNPICKLLPYV